MAKKFTPKKAAAVVFCLIIAFFFVTMAVRAFMYFVLHDPLDDSTTAAEVIKTSGAVDIADKMREAYPIDETAQSEYNFTHQQALGEEKQKSTYEKYAEVLSEKTDFFTSHRVIFRLNIVKFNFNFKKLIGQKVLGNGSSSVVMLNNGYLTDVSYRLDESFAAQNTKKFKEKLASKNIDFIYFQLPFKIDPDNPQLPAGAEDYYNRNADDFLKLIDGEVDYIDLRAQVKDEFPDYYSAFFRTDHHWTPDCALWAAGKGAQALNKYASFNIDTSVYNKANFSHKLYKEWFLGAQGKAATTAFADPDDFVLVEPEKKYDYTVTYNPPFGEEKSGTFSQTMIDMSKLAKKDYYNLDPYAAYLGGIHPIVSIVNHSAAEHKKVLIIGESFSSTFAPFLSLGIERVDLINRNRFSGSIEKYIEKTNPDVVIVAANPGAVNSVRLSIMDYR